MFLLDDTSNHGSDAGYKPGDNLRNSYNPINPQDDAESYPSMNAGQEINPDPGTYSSANNQAIPSDFEGSGYESQNKSNFSNPEFQNSQKAKDKARLIDEAKRLLGRGQATVQRTIPKKIGEAIGDKHLFKDGSEQGREQAKDFAKQKTRDFAKDKIGKKLAEGGIKKGFEKGLEKGVGKAAKEGAKKAAGKAAGKAIGKAAGKVVAKGAAKVGSAAIVEGGVAAAGAAAGAVTFGVGFLISLLIDIAISLGINDAIDAVFELKEGNIKQATFLAIRGGTKVGVFIWFLIAVVLMFSVAGVFIAAPMIIGLNIYMIMGAIPAFKGIPQLQGMVLWEKILLIAIDVMAFLILVAFIAGIVWYLCSVSGLGSGTISGAVTGAYDWWAGGNSASFANSICTQVKAPAVN